MSNDQYTCALCGGTFDKGWSEEEAEAEAKLLWGDMPEEDREVICDTCFQSEIGDIYEQWRKDHGETKH